MSTKPNVILCVSDQLRAFAMGCYGHPVVRTPNLDALARGGVRFEHAISNNPVCCPARAILMSGQYSRTCTGMRGNVCNPAPGRPHLVDPTLPEMFRAGGYHTQLIGKWHLLTEPHDAGFDDAVFPTFFHRHRDRVYFDAEHPYPKDRPPVSEDDGFGFKVTDQWTWDFEFDRLLKFLKTRDKSRPFFLYFNIEPPHMPLADAPERYRTMYTREQIEPHIRPNARDADGRLSADEDWFRIYMWDYQYYMKKLPHTLDLPRPDFNLADLEAMYAGLVTLVDDQVGKLVQALKDEGIFDDTLLLFTADHGDDLGSHGAFNKGRPSEESLRVPMIAHWPAGLRPRVVTRQVASLIDVMPTLLSLAGLPSGSHMQGQDLGPVMRGERDALDKDYAFFEVITPDLHGHKFGGGGEPDGAVGVRTPDHLYAARLTGASLYEYRPENDVVKDDRHMFFDLRSDPYQMKNLAKSGPASADENRLRQITLDWHASTPWLQDRRK